MTPVLCIVTIHGIGFQQPPQPGVPGYADALHEHLSKLLDVSILSDDPNRKRSKHGENGPIYVQSCWPPGSNNREMGLARLGSWTGPDMRKVDTTKAPLTNGQGSIAHIALVYSNLEGQGESTGAALLAAGMAASSLSHYIHVTGLVRMFWKDAQALSKHDQAQGKSGSGLLTILQQLENDVAAYVCREELRERIRCFVVDALLRLVCRKDVAGIVLNGHSNGSVIAYDALRQLPPFAAAKVKACITSGSPLRKYVDLFCWGREIENYKASWPWFNFWDPRDPVADPLVPPLDWRREMPIPISEQRLFRCIDPCTGVIENIDISDIQVDNLRYSRGDSFPGHDYWDNEEQFVTQLVRILQKVAARGAEVAVLKKNLYRRDQAGA